MPRTLWSMICMKGINMCDYVDVSGDTMGTVRILLEYRITVLGGFSGRGKSRFVSETAIQVYRTEDDLRQYTFVTESSLPKRTFPDGSDPKVFRDTLRNGESFVLLADEEFVLECLPDVLLSRHKVLVIARNRRLYNFVDARCLYSVDFSDNNKFLVEKITLNYRLDGVPDLIITEASNGKSENMYIRTVMPEVNNVVAASSRNRVGTVLRKCITTSKSTIRKVFIIIDLGASASALGSIIPIAFEHNIDVRFVEYTSFEALLYFSKLVQSIPASDIAHDTREKSIELYYEKLLYNVTRGTKLESSHPNFSECCIKNCSCCCEFSQPSLLLKTLFSKEGLQLLKWYWNTYHPEWVPLTDAVISVLKASYNPKGF